MVVVVCTVELYNIPGLYRDNGKWKLLYYNRVCIVVI